MEDVNFFENLADLDLGSKVKIPHIIKDVDLMPPGTWNNFYYSSAVIHNAFRITDWNDKKILSLFLDHLDDRTSEWVGYVSNPHMRGGKLIGDLEIYDINTAVKLALGKPKFGISPRVKGKAEEGIMRRFLFENFSFVINPAVKTNYINNMEVRGMDFKLQEEGKEGEAEEATPTEPTETEPKTETKEEPKEPKKELKKNKDEEEEEPKKKDEDEEMGESLSAYTDFIKKYMKSHKGATIKDAAAAWKKNHEAVEMAEESEQFLKAMEIVLKHLKKDKDEKPEDKYPYKKSEMGNVLEAKELQVKELSARVESLEAKLNEPDRVTVKADGTTTQMLTEYSDEAFIKYLAAEQNVVEV